MTFNTGAFTIAGTAIAILGVGLYLWDTRGSQMLSSPTSNTYSSPPLDTRTTFSGGRSKRNRKNLKSKTKRR